MHSIVIFLGLFQLAGSAHAPMAEQMQREIVFAQLERQTDAGRLDDMVRRHDALQHAEFEQRFNKLVEAITAFGKTYNERGTVDAKQVLAMKKAWKDLEKNDPLFAEKKKK